jgi:hypothetical protein
VTCLDCSTRVDGPRAAFSMATTAPTPLFVLRRFTVPAACSTRVLHSSG